MSDHEDPSPRQADIPRAEWLAAAVGVLLLLGSIGVVVRQAVVSRGSPPVLELRASQATKAGSYWLVRVDAANRGERTAAGLEITGTLRFGGSVVEESRATIDYLPPRSRRSAGLYFTKDPRTASLELRPTGYQDP